MKSLIKQLGLLAKLAMLLTIFTTTTASGQNSVQVLQHPISPLYTYNGRCPGGFAAIDVHMYYDPLFGAWHMGSDINGYNADGSPCGNADEGAEVRAIGNGTIVLATDQGPGRGKVMITRHILPDDNRSQVDFACYHLKSFDRTSGPVAAGTLVAKLGRTGNVPAHLHCEATVVSATGTMVNPWADACTAANQSAGFCIDNPNQIRRPLMTAAHARRYVSPSLLLETRMYGVTRAISGSGALYRFTVGMHAPAAFTYVSRGSDRKSINSAVAAGWIRYGLLYARDNSWYYRGDSTDVTMHPGSSYGIWPLVDGLGLTIAYVYNTPELKDDLARFDLVKAANEAGLKYIDPSAMVRNPPYASSTEFDFFAMPATKTTNAVKGDANFKHVVLIAMHRTEPWTRRLSSIWDGDQRAWGPWRDRGNTVP